MTTRRAFYGVAASFILALTFGPSVPSFGQTASTEATVKPAEASSPSSDWTVTVTPYAWLTAMSGSQTVKGRTVPVDTNVIQMFDKSQSLVPFMGYVEARFQDRVGLFLDVMYANLTAGDSAQRNYALAPGVAATIGAQASVNYESLTAQFGAAYQVVKVGKDRSDEGPGMAGVGQTAFDVMGGGRWWYQRADMTFNVVGTLNVVTPDLEMSADRTKAIARSGVVTWVDPFVGFRVKHKAAPHQDLSLEADLGGFGIGSRISYQALGAYRFGIGTTGSAGWAGVLGYRVLYVDYIQGSGSSLFEMNLLQHGPVIGVSAKF